MRLHIFKLRIDRICNGIDGGLDVYFDQDIHDTQEFFTIDQSELSRLAIAIHKRLNPIPGDDCRR